MLVLIGIGFLAGVVTAVSPCVLPVLPVLLAGGASGRKPLRIVAGLVVSFSVFTLFAAWLLDQVGLPDDFLRNLAIALLFVMAATLLVPQIAQLIERPLAVVLALPADRRWRRLLPRRDARTRLRPVRRPGARDGHGRRRAEHGRLARDRADARLRDRCGGADAADRARRTRGIGAPAAACRLAADRVGRHDRRRRAGAHLPLRRSHRSVHAWLHDVPAEQDREELRRDEGARQGARRKGGARRGAQHRRLEPTGLRRRAADPRRRRVDQLAAADVAAAARQGRAGRLLDVLVHQLPADAAAPEGVVRGLPREGPRHHRRAHARVRVRARHVERAGRSEATRRHVAGRAGQQVQDLGQLREPVLAGRVSDRPRGPRAPHALRRRRVRQDGDADPHAARSARARTPATSRTRRRRGC